MKLIFKNALCLCLLVSLSSMVTHANTILANGKTEFTKTIKKSFNMNAGGEVTLANKYGDIKLKTWDRDEVNIEVTITVNARSESSADNIFNRIDVDFSNSSRAVSAKTQIESKRSNYWGNNEKGDFRIDYEVSMPNRASLVLSNKYGDAEIDAIGGDADVKVKYGNFNLESVGENANIDLGYGNGTIGTTKGVGINIKYSKIKLKQADQVNIESKYSKIYVDRAGLMKSVSKYDSYDLGELQELNSQGKYDHFEIEKVGRVSAYAKYSDFKLDELVKGGNFELKYGGVKIDKLHNGFEELKLSGEHADCKIYMEEQASFQLDAVASHATVRYPTGMEVVMEKKKDYGHEIKGYKGSKNSGKITARMKYGSLKVR